MGEFSSNSSADVFSLAPFPQKECDVFLQVPFSMHKQISGTWHPTRTQHVVGPGSTTAPHALSTAGQQPIPEQRHTFCSFSLKQPITQHHGIKSTVQGPIAKQNTMSGLRQKQIPSHHAVSSIMQQPITAHRVVSNVGQQAAVGSVSVGPLYSWTLNSITSKLKNHDEH